MLTDLYKFNKKWASKSLPKESRQLNLTSRFVEGAFGTMAGLLQDSSIKRDIVLEAELKIKLATEEENKALLR